MNTLCEETLVVDGLTTRLLRGGSGPAAIVFLHGGVPAITPFCSGGHIWTNAITPFSQSDLSLIALDLPGHGGSTLHEGALPTLERRSRHVVASLERLGLGAVHLIGHNEGGLTALCVAIDRPDLVRSVVVVASPAAAPSGDLLDNPTLAYPPSPLWSRESQRWALNRLSSSACDELLLDACVGASKSGAHLRALRMASDNEMYSTMLAADLLTTKARVFTTCRDSRIPVPVQLIWGHGDPLTSVDQGLHLFRIIAATQPATTFHVLSAAGHLVFNEKPRLFQSTVMGFYASLTMSFD
jgi:pimeloyl-ACP methyl ester carboxylesterase